LPPCTTLNCNATFVRGNIKVYEGRANNPWVTNLILPPLTPQFSECVRLEVTDKDFSANVALVLATWTGRAYRARSAAGSNAVIVLKGSPNFDLEGMYTVQVGTARPLEGEITLAYGIYSGAGNPNCASPTAPLGGNQ
jgi:hypothetical protein